jgi:PleD family two-component response regulator
MEERDSEHRQRERQAYQGFAVAISVALVLCFGALDPAGDTPSTLLDRADAALYRAKQAGKNRCAT